MKSLFQKKTNEILNLPYKERLEPANEFYNSLIILGKTGLEAKKMMRAYGIPRSLLFRLPFLQTH